jgi:hypothetical protein
MDRRGPSLAAVVVVLALVVAACGSEDPAPTLPRAAEVTTTTEPEWMSALGSNEPPDPNKLRVLLAGDSVMQNLAPAVSAALNGGGEAQTRFVIVSRLAGDASAQVAWQEELEEFEPDLVVALLGAWETISPAFQPTEPGWPEQFAREAVDPFVEAATADGASLLWISVPRPRVRPLALGLATLGEQLRRSAERDERVDFLDGSGPVLAPDGTWTEFLPGPDGMPQRVRRIEEQGLHLCPDGVVRLAEPVLAWVVAQEEVPLADGWQQGDWRRPPLLPVPSECPEG